MSQTLLQKLKGDITGSIVEEMLKIVSDNAKHVEKETDLSEKERHQ